MDQMDREMSERRALRDRNLTAAREQAAENLREQGKVADRVADYMSRKAAGESDDKRTSEDDVFSADNLVGDDPDLDEPAGAPRQQGFLGQVQNEVTQARKHSRHAVDDDEDEDFSKTNWLS